LDARGREKKSQDASRFECDGAVRRIDLGPPRNSSLPNPAKLPARATRSADQDRAHAAPHAPRQMRMPRWVGYAVTVLACGGWRWSAIRARGRPGLAVNLQDDLRGPLSGWMRSTISPGGNRRGSRGSTRW